VALAVAQVLAAQVLVARVLAARVLAAVAVVVPAAVAELRVAITLSNRVLRVVARPALADAVPERARGPAAVPAKAPVEVPGATLAEAGAFRLPGH
jgi:hypothetical protein